MCILALDSFVFRVKHAVSEDTEVFQGEALGKAPDGYVLLLVHFSFRLFRNILGRRTFQISRLGCFLSLYVERSFILVGKDSPPTKSSAHWLVI